MIIFGWGKGAKKLADLGFMKCGNCKNYSWFSLFEVSSKVKLYFVPVAKYGKRYVMACPICQGGIEVTKEEKDEILRGSVGVPTQELSIEIWNKLDAVFTDLAKSVEDDESFDGEQYIEKELLKLREQYGEKDVDPIAQVYIQFINDDDMPK